MPGPEAGSRRALFRGDALHCHYPWRLPLYTHPRAPARGKTRSSRPSQSAISRNSSCSGSATVLASTPGSRWAKRDQQLRDGPVGLEIDATDQPVAQQEGQDVVAMFALGDRRVDLDAIEEIEDAFRTVAFPDQRVEGGQQGTRLDVARLPCFRIGNGRLLPSLDRHRQQIAGFDQLGQPRLGIGNGQPEIVA